MVPLGRTDYGYVLAVARVGPRVGRMLENAIEEWEWKRELEHEKWMKEKKDVTVDR